jgi:hypothetical protein
VGGDHGRGRRPRRRELRDRERGQRVDGRNDHADDHDGRAARRPVAVAALGRAALRRDPADRRRAGEGHGRREGEVSGGTIIRVETDADGNAAYEAHMTDSSGAPVTVYVDKNYDVVSVETR